MEEKNKTAGFLALRMFFAQFWLLQMIGKARDQETGITSFRNLVIWSSNVGAWMAKTTPIPVWAVKPFTLVLPYFELALGVLLLLGLQTRRALIASALAIVALDVGLMFQLKHEAVAMNTVTLLATLLALHWSPYDRWSADSMLFRSVPNQVATRKPAVLEDAPVAGSGGRG